MTAFDFQDDDPLADLDDFGDEDDGTAAIEQFEATVEQQMAVLLNRTVDVRTRREAAAWLGESGSPKAIMALRRAYQQDADKSIREAAAYALGQFKMLDESIERNPGEDVMDALGRPENAWIVELLEDITLNGGGENLTGTGGGTSPVWMKRLMLVLGLTLVFLIAFNILGLLGGGDDDGGQSVAEIGVSEDDPAYPALRELAVLRERAASVQADAGALRGEFAAAAGGPLACAATLNRTQAYIITPEIGGYHPDFASIAIRLNASLNIVNRVLETYDSACSTGTAVDAGAVTEAESLLATVIDSDMPELIRLIEGTRADLLAEPPQPTAAPDLPTSAPMATEFVATAAPTEIVETAIPTSVLVTHRSQLLGIINRVTELRGPLGILNQYWQDVQVAGETFGCRQIVPALPEPYTDITPEVAAAYPELQQAANEINDIGLALLESGWTAFTNACQQGTLTEQLQTGLITVQTIQDAFDNARARLEGLEF